ncbi:MAG: GyrI-like domain-containing protein [Candidatus Berkiella sp.]
MKSVATYKPDILLVGLTVRTNNTNEQNPATGKIGPLVSDYFSQGMATTIPNRVNPGVTFSVYTDYESDHHGDYTYLIGEEVSSFEDIPSGLHRITIPASDYQRFTTPSGQMPMVVINAWQAIWQMDETALGGVRAYQADFEVYDDRAIDPNNAVVDVYIGTKAV